MFHRKDGRPWNKDAYKGPIKAAVIAARVPSGTSTTTRAPSTGRGIAEVQQKIEILDAYVGWREPRKIDFEQIVGHERWLHYWQLCEALIKEMAECQVAADDIKRQVLAALVPEGTPPIA